MALDSYTSSAAKWTGKSSWTYIDGTGNPHTQDIDTRMTLTLSGANFLDASSLGSTVGVLAPVLGDYSANILFEAYFGTTIGWKPVNDGYNSFHHPAGVGTETNFLGGFYYTPVPVPAAVWLFGSGLAGLVGLKRRYGKR